MRSAWAWLFFLALLAAFHAPALAEEEMWPAPSTKPVGSPKPLLAVPSGTAAPAPDDEAKLDPSGIPKVLADARKKMREEYTGWLTDNKALQAECDAVHTPSDRKQCEMKKKVAQAKLDDIHFRMRQILRKIDTWRRKEQGLPPPDWWPPENQPLQKAITTPDGKTMQENSAPKKDNSVLLPQGSAPLPANTF